MTVSASLVAAVPASAEPGLGCRPTDGNRPVCPAGAPPELANFLDSTVTVEEPENVFLGGRVYVGPFAKLIADDDAPITIDDESNVQDSVRILAEGGEDADDRDYPLRNGLDEEEGVEIADRVILAHGAAVKGPAKVGIGGGDIEPDPDDDQEVFVSFGAEVDGAVLQRNTGISALGRVGPGVTLKSGFIVLPGKNVTTQAQADNPSLGKVRLLTVADVAFNEAVLEVNVALAREYSRLAYESRSNVRGINFDPGNTFFNHDRDLPNTNAEVPPPGTEFEHCDGGRETRVPSFRNRIIGEVCLEDSVERLDSVMGSEVSLRADEGEPLSFGHMDWMGSGFISHALEETTVEVGENVRYGHDSIVHGGGRRQDGGGRGSESTFIEDDVRLQPLSVTFRSFVGRGSHIGYKSAVVSSELAPGTRIPDRVIYLNNVIFGRVEW
ncbi:MAG: acetyltransferase [Thermoleophilaceae bacterium]|nr:acetyltransferase [Thermoleophilaceae bacterium]